MMQETCLTYTFGPETAPAFISLPPFLPGFLPFLPPPFLSSFVFFFLSSVSHVSQADLELFM